MAKVFTIFFLSIALLSSAQQPNLYPTNWWVGMKNNKVQILARANDPAFNKNTVTVNYPGLVLDKVTPMENGKYISIDVVITAEAKPGTAIFEFKTGKKTQKVNWPIKPRNSRSPGVGVTSEDFIYLIMPDRFSNGD